MFFFCGAVMATTLCLSTSAHGQCCSPQQIAAIQRARQERLQAFAFQNQIYVQQMARFAYRINCDTAILASAGSQMNAQQRQSVLNDLAYNRMMYAQVYQAQQSLLVQWQAYLYSVGG